jgi:nucleoside-diphosphate-sugar epimerase
MDLSKDRKGACWICKRDKHKEERIMRIFVTGSTGFVGSAVVQDLIAAGHQVLGLARSDAAAKQLVTAGAHVHRGDLEDLESLRKGAADSGGVIHTGFNHDFSKFKKNCENDRKAIEALGSVLAGSARPLVITSGIGLLPSAQVATEETMPVSPNPNPRVASEEAARAMAARGVYMSVVRLAPSVHGDGDHGFVPILINMAREKGVSAYIDEGANRWPAVHRLDAAHLFRLAVEKAAKRAYYHGVAQEGVRFREIAEVIGRRLNIPLAGKSSDEAASHFTWFAHFAAMDVHASSKQTQEVLGWRPTQPGLIADIDRPSYFKLRPTGDSK